MWRSIDAKALYAATVAVSEVYDCLIADAVAATPAPPGHCATVVRGARRGSRSTASTTMLLAEFSTRATQVQASLRDAARRFPGDERPHPEPAGNDPAPPARHPQIPSRQTATRPDRAAARLAPTRRRRCCPNRSNTLFAASSTPARARRGSMTWTRSAPSLAAATVDAVMERRSTWTRWNLLAEAARAIQNAAPRHSRRSASAGRTCRTSRDRRALPAVDTAAADAVWSRRSPEPTAPRRFVGTAPTCSPHPSSWPPRTGCLRRQRPPASGRASTTPSSPACWPPQHRAPRWRSINVPRCRRSRPRHGRSTCWSDRPVRARPPRCEHYARHGKTHTVPGSVIGLAPSATAANELARSARYRV